MGIRLDNVSYMDKIKNISYEFMDGKITGVIGSSGSGKSLISYFISDIISDYDGSIISTYDIRDIGYVFQKPEEAFIFETVRDEIAFGIKRYNYKLDEIDDRINGAMKMVGLPLSYLDRSPFSLSSGERESLALAIILAVNPKVIVLDDPSVFLDNYGCDKLIRLLKKISSRYGKMVILFSSDVDFLINVIDNYVLLKNGKVISSGSKRDMFDDINKFRNAQVSVPRIIKFISSANKKYGVNLEYTFDIKELMKDIYRNVK